MHTMASHTKRELELSSTSQAILDDLENNGASFFDDLVKRTRLLKTEVEKGKAVEISPKHRGHSTRNHTVHDRRKRHHQSSSLKIEGRNNDG